MGIFMVSAVIVAGGKGTRMGAKKNKILLPLSGKEIISRTIDVFNSCSAVDEIIVVTAECDMDTVSDIVKRDKFNKVTHITEGGNTRQSSVYNGLQCVSGEICLIHDGARCLITTTEIENVINDTIRYGAAACGVTIKDTIKSIDENGNIVCTIDREQTVQIQTPQSFYTTEIVDLHRRAVSDNITVTDDCGLFEHYGKTVHLTLGSYDNIKITTPEDMAIGESILNKR